VIAGMVNIRARNRSRVNSIKREDVLKSASRFAHLRHTAIGQSEEPECRHLQC
jgi:hypothetical protein